MNTRTTLLFLALFVAAGFGAAKTLDSQVLSQGPNLTVFFTGDQNGEVASCGCPKEDIGGVTRRAAFLDTLSTSGWEYLLVDVGDMAPFEKLNSQGRLKIETMAQAMATMNYHAITLGDHDLAPGPDFVARIAGWLGQPILATNYDLPGIASDRTRVVTVRDKKVGLAAFLDPDLVMDLDWLEIEPWENQRARMEDLRSQCDVLVVLLHASQGPAVLRLAELYPEADLVLTAHEGLHAGPIYQHGQAYIAGSATRGRHLARVEVVFGADGKIADMASAYLPVVETWGRRPWTDTLLADYYADMRALVSSDEFMREQMAALEEPVVEFVGNEACISCHEAEGAQWKTTPHSHARQTLVDSEKDHDPECQVCHTTGFGYRTGFANPEATPGMWEVGCESCHGAGADHVESQEELYGSVSETVCRSCHDQDQSPDFSYSAYRPRIVHAEDGSDD